MSFIIIIYQILTVFSLIRPAYIIIFHGLQVRILLEKCIKLMLVLLESRVSLGLQVLFEGGSYQRKYGPNVSTTPITAMGRQQCLPLSII